LATASAKPYKATFVQADEAGDYVNLGSQYKVRISDDTLMLSKERIPLIKVLKTGRIGKGVELIYLDAKKVPTRVLLTTSTLFGIGREKRLGRLIEEIESAISAATRKTPQQDIAEARQVASADTCHDCGETGGQLLKFGEVYSAVLFARWSSSSGVYCKKHATLRGLRATLLTGAIGWWSPWGVFIAPVYLGRNLKSLWTFSNVPKPLVAVLGIACFLPVLVIVNIVRNW
jgi:hypothetical protein